MRALYFLAALRCCAATAFEIDMLSVGKFLSRKSADNHDLNQTFFAALENFQVDATPTTEAEYPWIARVVHSRSTDYPYVCTASCISERIFITASRCIYSLKVIHTNVIYMNHRLPVLTFVTPSNVTKQSFDDVGLIVVEKEHYTGVWETVGLVNRNRTGDGFQWFADWELSMEPPDYKVVGYATEKSLYKIRQPDREYSLYELDIVININICTTILTFNFLMQGFYVPCYHSCTLQQFNVRDDKCNRYHGVEGGAVIDMDKRVLLGVVTWGPIHPSYSLPVGFSVPNSDRFHEDYECAARIRDDNGVLVSTGYYQSLCVEGR